MSLTLLCYGLMKQTHDEPPSEQRRQACGEKPHPPHCPTPPFLSLSLWRAVFLEPARFYQTQFKIFTEEPGESRLFLAHCNMVQEITRILGCLRERRGGGWHVGKTMNPMSRCCIAMRANWASELMTMQPVLFSALFWGLWFIRRSHALMGFTHTHTLDLCESCITNTC